MPPRGRRNNSLYLVNRTRSLEADSPTSCRVKTESGAIYWLSAPDADGLRIMVREKPTEACSSTMLVQAVSAESKSTRIGRRFRGRLSSDVEIGSSLVIEVKDAGLRVLSEVAVEIEVGKVPDAVFE